MYAHKEMLTKHNVAVTDLPEKTQKNIAKFDAETDEDKREALDEKIHGDVEDFIEAKEAKEKADKKKASFAAAKEEAKKKKAAAAGVDVSQAPTAAGATPPAAAPAKPQKSIMHRAFGFKD